MKFIWIILMMCMVVFTHSSAAAQAEKSPKPAKSMVKPLKVKSPAQAAQLVKKRTGGKILKVKPSGKKSYQVKVLRKDGHIVSMSVDAASGRVKGNK